MSDDSFEGLADWAVKALGFDAMCQCGHDFGLHEAPGTECSVFGCECGHFCAADPPQRWAVCTRCDGEGEIGTGRMSHRVDSATIDPPWEIMEPCPACGGAGGSLEDAA
jgi:hypothetical protein